MLTHALSIRPASGNAHPLRGVLVRGASALTWLEALSRLGLDPEHTPCYPVPGTRPNERWGAVLWLPTSATTVPPPYQALQCVHGVLLLPEGTALSPQLGAAPLKKLLVAGRHFWHPQLGLVELFEPVDWLAYLAPPPQSGVRALRPQEGVPFPPPLRYLDVDPSTVADGLAFIDQAALDGPHISEQEPLTPTERRRLEQLTRWRDAQDQPPPTNWMDKLWQRTQSTPDWTPELEQEYRGLAARARPNIDELLRLLRENPEKGLSYAPPLGSLGLGRGTIRPASGFGGSLLDWVPRWMLTSLDGLDQQGQRSSGQHGSSFLNENLYERLRQQYEATAQALIEDGKYSKAAFVYLRLLREPERAVEVLEQGQLYGQAASVCLQYLSDKKRAAGFAVQAQQWQRALQLYQELDEPLELGRVYEALHQPELAREQYERVLDQLLQAEKYADAGKFALRTLGERERARAIYLKGWRLQGQNILCLQRYLKTLPDTDARQQALDRTYVEDVTEQHIETYLKLLRRYHQEELLPQPWVEKRAYRAVADYLPQRSMLARQLLYFQRDDHHLGKDVLRFRRQTRKRKKS